jgi:hypothetical protein
MSKSEPELAAAGSDTAYAGLEENRLEENSRLTQTGAAAAPANQAGADSASRSRWVHLALCAWVGSF